MSNPINIPFSDNKKSETSYSCPSNFVLYNKNEEKRYSKFLKSMKKLGFKNTGPRSLNSDINIDNILYSQFHKTPPSVENIELFSSLNNDNSVNSINSNSSTLVEYMTQYMSESDSDENNNKECVYEENYKYPKIIQHLQVKKMNRNSSFVMDEELCYSDSEEEQMKPEINNIEEPQFTAETFMNVAKFLLKRDNNEI